MMIPLRNTVHGVTVAVDPLKSSPTHIVGLRYVPNFLAPCEIV